MPGNTVRQKTLSSHCRQKQSYREANWLQANNVFSSKAILNLLNHTRYGTIGEFAAPIRFQLAVTGIV
jgi:hypothetical protein